MRQFTKIEKEAPIDFENFRIHMQREMILRKLKEGGYRITKQRIAVIAAAARKSYIKPRKSTRKSVRQRYTAR